MKRRPGASLWLWFIVACVAICAACVVAVQREQGPQKARADPVAWAVSRARMTGSLSSGLEPYQLLIEPDDGERRLLRALNHAQHSIFLEGYLLTDHSILRALERAEAEGVAVYVLLEPHPFGMGPQPQHQADVVRAAGIAFRWSAPVFTLTHAKFALVDERLAIVSTANFSRAAFHGNREFVVLTQDPGVLRTLSALFRADWDRLPFRNTSAELVVSPIDARARIQTLITRARASLLIYSEEFADPEVERLLARAARRGVTVRLLLPEGATNAEMRGLAGAGARVGMLGHPYVHAKMVLADGREAFIGSENFSPQSLDQNREVGLLLRGPGITRIAGVFNRDWPHARPVGSR